MEYDTLLQTAKDFALREGRNLEEYSVASVQKEHVYTWVLFEGTSGKPGDHFSVCIDNQTGRALRLTPGR